MITLSRALKLSSLALAVALSLILSLMLLV